MVYKNQFNTNSHSIKILVIRLLFLYLTFFSFVNVHAQSDIRIDDNNQEILLTNNYSFFLNNSHQVVNANNILQKTFSTENNQLPLYHVGINDVWIKFSVLNKLTNADLYFDLRFSNLSKVALYKLANDTLDLINLQGNSIEKKYNTTIGPNFIFALNQKINTRQVYLLHVESIHPVIVPGYICSVSTLQKSNLTQFIIAALFTGVLSVMMIYNLFLYFAVQDKSYIIYVLYTFSLLVAQLTADGYLSRYLWTNHVFLNTYSVIWTSNFPIISGMVFAINFLQIKRYAPKIRFLFLCVIVIALVDMLLSLFHLFNLSYLLLNYNSLITGLLIFFTSVYIAKRGYKPAYLYFVAWISMLIAIVLLALRNISLLPYNNFTSHVIYIGAAIEATMLSFALADKINTYKKEKEDSQEDALRVSKENEKLIQEQNVMLEKQVAERTYDLENTLRELKDAQIQLVESEKMASLGQLTAGIAHEINNPINFVKSNVSPLQMDVQDLFELITEYQKLHRTSTDEQPVVLKQIKALESKLDPDFLKEEIESLIGGIEEGAERTAEIVRGLRNFSRLDESETKEVNVYENINSTLILLRNNMPHYLKIRKYFEARAEIECYPGKLNQVFMNILTNCIQAIVAKPVKDAEEYIDIHISEADDYMRIRITDTGIGMTKEVKHKIFDPFFTTKDVGEGTGLGMAIVFKIIEKHHGKITVQSSPGEGATFIIDIPYMLTSVPAIAENEAADLQ